MIELHTRIIPAKPENSLQRVTKQADGSMAIEFGDGRTGNIPASDIEIQAFAVWTMLNPDCTK